MRKPKDLPRPYDDHDLDSAYQAGIMYERKRILKELEELFEPLYDEMVFFKKEDFNSSVVPIVKGAKK